MPLEIPKYKEQDLSDPVSYTKKLDSLFGR